ncbi:MAG: glycerophosphodiester phosphodiesterase family protein, partial [Natronospirillum sp.]
MIAEPLIAHRGCSLLQPENTLAAMTLTRDLGIGWVEVDANVLGDGTLVMFHDDNLDRLTNGHGLLADQRWASVRDLDVGSHFSSEYRAERIPSLKQALAHIQDLGLGLNLEIKLYPHFTPAHIVAGVTAILDELWVDFSRLIISSFNTEALRLLHAARPSWQLGHLCEEIPAGWEAIADELALVSVHCDY